MKSNQYAIISFGKIEEGDGSLIVAEADNEIPFAIKRIFYIMDVPKDAIRGNHANKKTDFVLVCLHGKCKLTLNNGNAEEVLYMNRADRGVLVPRLTWMKLSDFSKGCIVMVLASEKYEKNQYYEEYSEFKKLCCKEMGEDNLVDK